MFDEFGQTKCPKCKRVLSPMGRCLYCQTIKGLTGGFLFIILLAVVGNVLMFVAVMGNGVDKEVALGFAKLGATLGLASLPGGLAIMLVSAVRYFVLRKRWEQGSRKQPGPPP
jgi:hypothetical protein